LGSAEHKNKYVLLRALHGGCDTRTRARNNDAAHIAGVLIMKVNKKILKWYLKEAMKQQAFATGDIQDNLKLTDALKAIEKGFANYEKERVKHT